MTWVDPSHARTPTIPTYTAIQGPSWVSSIVNAIGESTYWNSTAIVVVWDDWGGWYDNAPPPQLDYGVSASACRASIISPYAKHEYVDHTQYEFGSILRFIEEVNGLPAGSIGPVKDGYTDGRATGLSGAFDFTKPPRKFSAIPSKYPRSYFLQEPPSNEPVDTQ